MKKYLMSDIVEYLNGCLISHIDGTPCEEMNTALSLAIANIDDKNDGLDEMIFRREDRKKVEKKKIT